MKALEPQVAGVTLPLYVMHGLKDATTSFEAISEFVERAGSSDKTFIKVDGDYVWRLRADWGHTS